MAVEVKRKQNESAESLLRRFKQRVLQSGTINQAKFIRFKNKRPSRLAKKVSALRRLADRKKREYLIKTGAFKPQSR